MASGVPKDVGAKVAGVMRELSKTAAVETVSRSHKTTLRLSDAELEWLNRAAAELEIPTAKFIRLSAMLTAKEVMQ